MDSYLSFIGISFLLIVVPGPSILLIVSNSIAHGRLSGLVTVAGTSAGMIIPLTVTTIGLGALAQLAAGSIEILRLAGVLYLAASGLHKIVTAKRQAPPEQRFSHRGAFWQGFLVSLANPATTPFFLAFLPQFVDPGRPAMPQLLVLSISFLLLALVLDSLYALLAARLGRSLESARSRRWRERLSGGLMLAAAAVLLATQVS